MPPVGFELTISAGERPQTYALDRAATGTGICNLIHTVILNYGRHLQEFSVVKIAKRLKYTK